MRMPMLIPWSTERLAVTLSIAKPQCLMKPGKRVTMIPGVHLGSK